MINLQTIIDGLEMVDDMNRVFFNTETNETVYLSEFDPELTADTAELMEARLYVTHPGVTADGIMSKMGV